MHASANAAGAPVIRLGADEIGGAAAVVRSQREEAPQRAADLSVAGESARLGLQILPELEGAEAREPLEGCWLADRGCDLGGDRPQHSHITAGDSRRDRGGFKACRCLDRIDDRKQLPLAAPHIRYLLTVDGRGPELHCPFESDG